MQSSPKQTGPPISSPTACRISGWRIDLVELGGRAQGVAVHGLGTALRPAQRRPLPVFFEELEEALDLPCGDEVMQQDEAVPPEELAVGVGKAGS